jgi:signal transduction histidine kinase
MDWSSELLITCAVLAVAALALGISLILSRRAVRLQKPVLRKKDNEIASLHTEVLLLRENVKRANHTIGKDSEDVLRRISADLHDGPTQKLGLALQRVGGINYALVSAGADSSAVEEVRVLVSDSMREINDLSSLLHMPEISSLNPMDVVGQAIQAHQSYSKTNVDFSVQPHPSDVRPEIKSCAYRFVQEALTNGHRHARGAAQQVMMGGGVELMLTVLDNGPGLSWPDMNSGRLGLRGMKARIEALDGELTIQNRPEGGLSLTARFQNPGT